MLEKNFNKHSIPNWMFEIFNKDRIYILWGDTETPLGIPSAAGVFPQADSSLGRVWNSWVFWIGVNQKTIPRRMMFDRTKSAEMLLISKNRVFSVFACNKKMSRTNHRNQRGGKTEVFYMSHGSSRNVELFGDEYFHFYRNEKSIGIDAAMGGSGNKEPYSVIEYNFEADGDMEGLLKKFSETILADIQQSTS